MEYAISMCDIVGLIQFCELFLPDRALRGSHKGRNFILPLVREFNGTHILTLAVILWHASDILELRPPLREEGEDQRIRSLISYPDLIEKKQSAFQQIAPIYFEQFTSS